MAAALAWWRGWGAAALSAGLICWASWEYVAEVARRKADPRLASWLIWTCAMGVGAAGAWSDGQRAAALLGAASGASCLAVIAAGLRHGDAAIGWLDAAGACAGGVGLVLLIEAEMWPLLLPMDAAIAVSVVTDLAAFAPTFANARRGREAPAPYAKFAAAAAVTLTAATPAPSSLIYPAYELAACLAAAALAAAGLRRRSAASGPPEPSPGPDDPGDGWVAAEGDGWPRPQPAPEVHHDDRRLQPAATRGAG